MAAARSAKSWWHTRKEVAGYRGNGAKLDNGFLDSRGDRNVFAIEKVKDWSIEN